MTTPVHVLGPSSRQILGLPLGRHLELAVRRAGLALSDAPPYEGDVIVVDADVVVTAAALSALASAPRPAGGAVTDSDGRVARIAAITAHGARSVADCLRLAWPIDSRPLATAAAASPTAETLLLRAATKTLLPGDHVGVLNRELTLPLVRLLARTPLRPNHVTLLGFAVTVASAVPLALGGYGFMLLGAFLQWVGSLLDGVDGKLARLKGQTSKLGAWLDVGLDFAYYAILAGALAVGLARERPAVAVALVAAVILAGLAVSVPIVTGLRRRLTSPDRPDQAGPRIWQLVDRHRADALVGLARATLRFVTRAGLPHVVLLAALLDALPAVFALGAVAAHLVWIVTLRLERLARAGTVACHV